MHICRVTDSSYYYYNLSHVPPTLTSSILAGSSLILAGFKEPAICILRRPVRNIAIFGCLKNITELAGLDSTITEIKLLH